MSYLAKGSTCNGMRGPGTAFAPTATGAGVALVGLGLVGAGILARRDVARSLSREHIVGTADMSPANAPVRSAAAARSLAEVIRSRTVAAAAGHTYAETDEFLASGGGTTSDEAQAIVAEGTGQPVRNPAYELWVTSTTLQTALMQAYMAFRLADLTTGLGATIFVAGAGIASSGRRS